MNQSILEAAFFRSEISLLKEVEIRRSSNIPTWIMTVNLDIYRKLKSEHNILLLKIIIKESLIVADGAPIAKFLSLLRSFNVERITGADLVIPLINLALKSKSRIIFAGGPEGDAYLCKEIIKRENANADVHSTSLRANSKLDHANEVRELRSNFNYNFIFIGNGSLKSEFLISELFFEQPNCLYISCGAGISFFAGSLKRAPYFFQKLNLEWLWRFILDPKRLFVRYFIIGPMALWQIFIDVSKTKYAIKKNGI